MKSLSRNLLLAFSFVAATAFGAATPSLDVTVTDSSGKVAYKGKTNPAGTFSTGKVGPGNYVVQFSSKSAAPSGEYMLVVSAGKKKVSADSVDGAKFAKGGVAMRLDGIAGGTAITGQVAGAASVANSPNVKIMNGKKYYWVKNNTGSNLGGRWMTAEEAKASGLPLGSFSNEAVQSIQEKGYNPRGN